MTRVETNSDECLLIERNDVLGTRTKTYLPETVDEALRNCKPLLTARSWVDQHEYSELDDELSEPIGCSIRHTGNRKSDQEPNSALDAVRDTIIVHWYVASEADMEDALEAISAVLDGSWQRGWR